MIKFGLLLGISNPRKKTITKRIFSDMAVKYLFVKSDISPSPINSVAYECNLKDILMSFRM